MPRRRQFRLRTLLVLVTLVATSLLVTRLWHQQMVRTYTTDWYDEHDPEFLALRAEMERRFTPGLSFIMFVGCCGLWYAIRQRERTSEMVLGGAFALPLVCVLHPIYGAFPALLLVGLTALVLRVTPAHHEHLNWLLCVPAALLYSAWPLVIRRYVAALALFLFAWFYEWFSVTYFIAADSYFGG